MDLLARVNEAMTAAMRSRDKTTLGSLRMLKTALVNRRSELGQELTNVDAQKVVATLAKQRQDSIAQFEQAGRTELVTQEKAELEALQPFLPPPVDEAAIERIIDTAITETGATAPRDMGRVMKQVMAQFAGQVVDGSTIGALVKQKLAQ